MIRGNDGADHFVFRAGDGNDRILDYRHLGAATDDLIVISRALYRAMEVSSDAQGVLLDFGLAGTLLLVGGEANLISRGDFLLT